MPLIIYGMSLVSLAVIFSLPFGVEIIGSVAVVGVCLGFCTGGLKALLSPVVFS